VATLLLGSAIRLSRSTLHVATLAGCDNARLASVRVAANLRTGFGEERKSWRTLTASQKRPKMRSSGLLPEIVFVNWDAVIFFISQIARAASKFTMSLLCRNQPSRSSSIGFWRLRNIEHRLSWTDHIQRRTLGPLLSPLPYT